MKKMSFRWYLKRTLSETAGTLNLRKLVNASKEDQYLRALFALYASAYLSQSELEARFKSLPFVYGEYYYEDGYPDRDSIRAMPDEYHQVYDGYIRALSESRTNIRIKAKCREEILELMEKNSVSQRAIGKLCDVDFACLNRFMQGSDYALSAERLKPILDTLREMEIEQKAGRTESKARLYIDNYNEVELTKGLVEISFTLNIADNDLAALRKLCEENEISFPELIERFLNWLLTDIKSAGEWIMTRRI